MEIFKIKHDIPFMSYARVTSFISALTFVLAVVFLVVRGLNFGVDFTGGTVMEINYGHPAELQQIRDTLTQAGFHNPVVQNFGNVRDVMVRMQQHAGQSSSQLSDQVIQALKKQDPSATLNRVDYVGPQVGQELVQQGTLALGLVALGIMIYLAIRFEWRFSVAAIIATAHDVVIILGLFAFFQWEFDLTVLAAVLAILGYSVNDTVVVFDRIRENFRRIRKGAVPDIINNAITRTLSRTIMTHVMTQLMVFSMLFLGGQVLHYFALALTIGIVVGTYSSVLVASPIVMWLGTSRADFVKAEKKEARPTV